MAIVSGYPVGLIVLLIISLVNCQTPPESSARELSIPLFNGIKSQIQKTTDPLGMVKSIGDTIAKATQGGSVNEANENGQAATTDNLKPLGNILPALTLGKLTTTTSTTNRPSTKAEVNQTPGPAEKIGRDIDDFRSTLMGGTKLLEVPLKVLDGILSATLNITRAGTDRIDQATDTVVKASETTSKVVSSLASIPPKKHSRGHRKPPRAHIEEDSDEDEYDRDRDYYEFSDSSEPYAARRPKYFSRECPFRFACEVGKIMKPLTHSLTKQAGSTRLFQDLQNRYTRAMTYGSLRGNCDRYYCVLVALFGGPQGFASGVAELINRQLNPETYEVYDQ